MITVHCVHWASTRVHELRQLLIPFLPFNCFSNANSEGGHDLASCARTDAGRQSSSPTDPGPTSCPSRTTWSCCPTTTCTASIRRLKSDNAPTWRSWAHRCCSTSSRWCSGSNTTRWRSSSGIPCLPSPRRACRSCCPVVSWDVGCMYLGVGAAAGDVVRHCD